MKISDLTIIHLLLSLLILCSINSSGQSNIEKPNLIDQAQLKEDFTLFRNSLEFIHPALYRYKAKGEIDHLFDSCFNTLNSAMSEIQLFSKLKFLISAIEDGHLSCGPSDSSRAYYDKQVKAFPVQLKYLNGKPYVICSANGEIPPETEIISINEVPIEEITLKLLNYISSDGAIKTRKYHVLTNSFWFYYYMVYDEHPNYTIRYRRENGSIESKKIVSLTRAENVCLDNKEYNGRYLNLQYRRDIAVLTIKTFNQVDLDHSGENFRIFLETVFIELRDKGIHNLIIDLRGNGGGKDEFGSLLYSYLADKPYSYYESLETTSGKVSIKSHPNLRIQIPNKYSYNKQVLFLIDGLSFSATAEFCAVAKSNMRGIFIGEETGGGYYGNTSGRSVSRILPNTRIILSVPTVKYVMAVKETKNKNRGIIPDYIIIPTIKDTIKHRDVQLEFAIKLSSKDRIDN